MLFAEIDMSPLIVGFIIFALGLRQWGKWFKASPTLRKGAAKGGLWILGQLFKK